MVKWKPGDKRAIVDAIREAERGTTGEIRVHVKRRCGEDAFGEAVKAFRRLGLGRTREKNGVLVFVALDSHRFAVLGDKGIHNKVGETFWNDARDRMARAFENGDLVGAITTGVRECGGKLAEHFPRHAADGNELPDTVTED